MGHSLKRNSNPLGPCCRTMPRVPWCVSGWGAVSLERGTPEHLLTRYMDNECGMTCWRYKRTPQMHAHLHHITCRQAHSGGVRNVQSAQSLPQKSLHHGKGGRGVWTVRVLGLLCAKTRVQGPTHCMNRGSLKKMHEGVGTCEAQIVAPNLGGKDTGSERREGVYARSS